MQLDTFMLENGYYMSEYDNYVYEKRLMDGSFIYLLLYVDDMLILWKDMLEKSTVQTLNYGNAWKIWEL